MIEHIQINDVAPRIAYVADGVQSAFTYPFAIFKAADLEIWLGGERQTANFTVSGVGISTGGTVLFATPPAIGIRVTLRRRLSIARVSDYQADGIIRAKTLNDELDYQVAAIQQVVEDVARAVKQAPTSGSMADLTLPEPLAGRVLKWDGAGLALANSEYDPDTLGADLASTRGAREAAEAAAVVALAARDQAQSAAASVTDPLVRAQNLDDLPDKAAARNNLSVYSRAQVDSAFASSGVPQSLYDRMAFLELNLAVTVLRDQIDTGWSLLKMVDGVADEFEDETGIHTKSGATYDAVGDYYSNPPTAAVSPYAGATVVAGTFAAGGSNYAPTLPAYSYDGSTSTNWTLCNGSAASVTFGWLFVPGTSLAKIEVGGIVGYPVVNGTVMVSTDTTTGNDGTWITVVTGWNPAAGQLVALSIPPGIYKGLKIVSGITYISSPPAYYAGIFEIRVYGAVPAPNMILVSNTNPAGGHTLAAPPIEARVALLHQPVVAVTLNTDLIVEVSRDGGTSWTVGMLTCEGAFDATTNVLAAVLDLSGQPAGVSIRWRVRTLNNKEQRLHGVWLQWR